jgi:hypothetical protein
MEEKGGGGEGHFFEKKDGRNSFFLSKEESLYPSPPSPLSSFPLSTNQPALVLNRVSKRLQILTFIALG